MTLEQAKLFLLTPPPPPPREEGGGSSLLNSVAGFARANPFLLAAAAAAAGLLIVRPAPVRSLARSSTRVMRSPLLKRGLLLLATQLAARNAAR